MENIFKIEKQKSKNSLKIQISGNLTLSLSELIHKELKKLIDNKNELVCEINVINVEDIDYSFLQILISIYKSLKNDLHITLKLSEEYKSLVKSSGIINLMNIELLKN